MTPRELTGPEMLALEIGPPHGVAATKAELLELHERQLHAFLNCTSAAIRAGLIGAEDDALLRLVLFRLNRDLQAERREIAAGVTEALRLRLVKGGVA